MKKQYEYNAIAVDALRNEKGYNQAKILRAMTTDHATMRRWKERISYPTIDKLLDLCNKFDLNIRSFISGIDDIEYKTYTPSIEKIVNNTIKELTLKLQTKHEKNVSTLLARHDEIIKAKDKEIQSLNEALREALRERPSEASYAQASEPKSNYNKKTEE